MASAANLSLSGEGILLGSPLGDHSLNTTVYYSRPGPRGSAGLQVPLTAYALANIAQLLASGHHTGVIWSRLRSQSLWTLNSPF
jgi:hypothetical protein